MNAPLVEARDLVKVFGNGVRAVDGVSLDVAAGETFGLVGESGSGKSTVSALLLCLERPTSGTVRFQGEDLTSAGTAAVRAARRSMQLVMQDPVSALNRRKTVEQIVGLPLLVHGGAAPAARRARVLELLDLVGLPAEFLARYPHEMSGGQCQRVGIARALALEPAFVVLDESVSAVDVVMQAQILNLLKDLQRRLGLTYLFVSHDLAVVRYMCTRIAVMQAGRVVEVGSREQIFAGATHPYTRALIDAAPASLAARATGPQARTATAPPTRPAPGGTRA